MSYIGTWKFHSIASFDDDGGVTYLGREEYLASPMPYVDTEDEDAVADEMKQRKQMSGSALEVCEDGTLYMLMPLPEGVSLAEAEAAAAAGVISLRGGMITQDPMKWEEREGEFYLDFNLGGDEPTKVSEGGFIHIMSMRYAKEQ